jgi:hypothetical protein
MGFLNSTKGYIRKMNSISLQQWKAARRAALLQVHAGNEDAVDLALAYELIDTANFQPMGTAESAFRNRKGAAKTRQDVVAVKATVRECRTALAGLDMTDLVRAYTERMADAVEDLLEAEE